MLLFGRRLEAADDALAAPQPRVELPRVHRLDVGHLVGHNLSPFVLLEEAIRGVNVDPSLRLLPPLPAKKCNESNCLGMTW